MQMIFATPVTPTVDGIAAQARRRGTILVIVNDREFSRVPGLKTEDWLPSSPQPIATLLALPLERVGVTFPERLCAATFMPDSQL
jgi:hypothetical protein